MAQANVAYLVSSENARVRLPQELIEHTMTFVPKDTLKSCTVLCKALMPYISSLYFRQLFLSHTWFEKGFLAAIPSSPRLTACVAAVTYLALNPTLLAASLNSASGGFSALKYLVSEMPRLQHLSLRSTTTWDDTRVPISGVHTIEALPRTLKTLEVCSLRQCLVDWSLQMFTSVEELIVRSWPFRFESDLIHRASYTKCASRHQVKYLNIEWEYRSFASLAMMHSILQPDVLEKITFKVSSIHHGLGSGPLGLDELGQLLRHLGKNIRTLEVLDTYAANGPEKHRDTRPLWSESRRFIFILNQYLCDAIIRIADLSALHECTCLETLTLGASCRVETGIPSFPVEDDSLGMCKIITLRRSLTLPPMPAPKWIPSIELLASSHRRLRHLHLALSLSCLSLSDHEHEPFLCVEAFNWTRLEDMFKHHDTLESITVEVAGDEFLLEGLHLEKCHAAQSAILARLGARMQSLVQFL